MGKYVYLWVEIRVAVTNPTLSNAKEHNLKMGNWALGIGHGELGIENS